MGRHRRVPGVGVLLGVVGAVFLFDAIDLPESWPVDEPVLGWIFLIGGLVVLVLSIVQQALRTRTKQTVERRTDVPDA